ncbi:Cold shock domain-containing protein E1 [Homalodisca vitripennis]|nr:Cold shock domain-containing protein E1 [Homalodisca vitripennis]
MFCFDVTVTSKPQLNCVYTGKKWQVLCQINIVSVNGRKRSCKRCRIQCWTSTNARRPADRIIHAHQFSSERHWLDDVWKSRQFSEGEENVPGYEFGITSLANKRELLQVGDPVQFQVDSEGRAANVTAIRIKKKATVESIKGCYGFLNYEVEEGKKLFFHMSEVKDREKDKLSPGDTVEFVLVTHNRNKKSFATGVSKLSEAQAGQRPERLISRLRTVSLDDGPKLVATRQPRGPDGTKGFSATHRVPRMPGVVLE